jgi:endonuclease YncB( thermonuclease family)
MKISSFFKALPLIAMTALLWNELKNQNATPNYPRLQPTALGEKLADSVPQKRLSPPTESWSVTKIADGDTITVRRGAEKMRVRFACIDAPEKAQPLGQQSKANLQRLISQAGGRVVLSVTDTDQYGRRVAEVFTA